MNKILLTLTPLVLLTALAGCSEIGQNAVEPEDPSVGTTDETENFSYEHIEGDLSKEEVEQRGLYSIPIHDSERMSRPILKNRRTTIDMRPDTPSSTVVDLEDAANLRWDNSFYNDYPCAIKGDIIYRSAFYWIFHPFAIDYGPVIARSVSPTQIQIIRKEEVSADQKPVEIALERSFIGMIPFELGVRATIVVELSDTPADSRDTDYFHYISMDQADAIGLFHMPFDSEEFRAPILEGGQKIVEFPEGESSITVELDSPAMPESNMVWHQGSTAIDGITYLDRDVKEWIFTPSKGQTPSLDFIMTDPLHITITRGEDFDFNYPNDMTILLGRGDYWNASDAGQTFAEICVVVK